MSLSGPAHITLRGTQTATVTIQMRIVSPDIDVDVTQCWESECPLYGWSPRVIVSRGLRLPADRWPPSFNEERRLVLVSGTKRDGIWRATTVIGAADAPAVTFQNVHVPTDTVPDDGYPGEDWVFALAGHLADPTIEVRGIDPPVIDVTTSPVTAPNSWRGTVKASLTLRLRDSKVRLAGRPLLVWDNNSVNWSTRTTDAKGRASFTFLRDGHYPSHVENRVYFYRINSGPRLDDVVLGAVFMGVPYRYAVSGSSSPSTVPLGSASTLQGNVNLSRAVGRTVIVQRWVSGQWRNRGQASVRASGRWSYVTTPPTKGTYVYRAWKPGDDCLGGRCEYQGAVTGAFTVAVR